MYPMYPRYACVWVPSFSLAGMSASYWSHNILSENHSAQQSKQLPVVLKSTPLWYLGGSMHGKLIDPYSNCRDLALESDIL